MLRKLKNTYHFLQAILANIYYGFPSRKLTVIAVTGTDGKTTTASILAEILLAAGLKTALITTVGAKINTTFYDTGFHTTTPSPFALQKYLKLAKSQGCTHVVLEATSHSIDQYRIWGIPIEIGILTNITREHLDYHKTYHKYLNVKMKLLTLAKTRIINKDDESFSYLVQILPQLNTHTYSLEDTLSLPTTMNIKGDYNMQNALAASAAAMLLGIEDETIKLAVSHFTAPEGRQEVVHESAFKVIVDFAHTPNSFEKVLPEMKAEAKGRLIHVFGAAGKRDRSKRALMGKTASNFDDVIILTAEDPRGEKIESICEEIVQGILNFERIDPEKYEDKLAANFYCIIPDRKNAIEFAINLAKKGDIVLLTGKGHEKSLNYTGRETPWSEKEAVHLAVAKLHT